MFDSYVEPNLSNLITNQAKISFIHRKWTVVIKGKIQFCSIFQIKKFDRNETVCFYNFEINQYTCMVVHVILIWSFKKIVCYSEWKEKFFNRDRAKDWLFTLKLIYIQKFFPNTACNMLKFITKLLKGLGWATIKFDIWTTTVSESRYRKKVLLARQSRTYAIKLDSYVVLLLCCCRT